MESVEVFGFTMPEMLYWAIVALVVTAVLALVFLIVSKVYQAKVDKEARHRAVELAAARRRRLKAKAAARAKAKAKAAEEEDD